MTEIIADQMQMLGRAGEENGLAPRNDNRQQRQPQPQNQAQPQAQPQQSYNQPQQSPNQAPAQGGAPAYDDQIDPPFNPDDDIPLMIFRSDLYLFRFCLNKSPNPCLCSGLGLFLFTKRHLEQNKFRLRIFSRWAGD